MLLLTTSRKEGERFEGIRLEKDMVRDSGAEQEEFSGTRTGKTWRRDARIAEIGVLW